MVMGEASAAFLMLSFPLISFKAAEAKWLNRSEELGIEEPGFHGAAGMNGKERLLKAMEDGLSKDFPVVIPYLEIFLRDHWEEVTDKPWWVMASWEIPTIGEVQASLMEKLGIDWVECRLCPSRRWRASHTIEFEGDQVFLKDSTTGFKEAIKRPRIGGEKATWVDKVLVKSKEDVDNSIQIRGHEELIEEGSLDYAMSLIEKFGSEKFLIAPISAPLWAAYHYMGIKGTLLNLLKNPSLVEYLVERLTLNALEILRAYAQVGIDGVWIEDCLCSADEISLSHFERFALPYVKRLISEIRHLGMKSIYYFCGDVKDRLERIVEAAPDAISLEESKKGFQIDILWVDGIVKGRACIFGNLDAINLLPRASKDELETELRRQIEVGRRSGRFVVSLGSPVTPETPLSRVREYVEIARWLTRSF
ncbi:MAG: uroporphyrinogen decarboxylase family protein [Candidatus Bathyarchaeia archaeon]